MGDTYDVSVRVLKVEAPGVLSNDFDHDGDALELDVALGTERTLHGSLMVEEDGSFKYTPDPGFRGIDYFQYRTFDGLEYGKIVPVWLHVADQ